LERGGCIHGCGAVKGVTEDAVSQTRKGINQAEGEYYRSAAITRRGWGHLKVFEFVFASSLDNF